MDNLQCSLEARAFVNFITSLNKKLFYNDHSVNLETISAYYASVDIETSAIQFEVSCFEEVGTCRSIYFFSLQQRRYIVRFLIYII